MQFNASVPYPVLESTSQSTQYPALPHDNTQCSFLSTRQSVPSPQHHCYNSSYLTSATIQQQQQQQPSLPQPVSSQPDQQIQYIPFYLYYPVPVPCTPAQLATVQPDQTEQYKVNCGKPGKSTKQLFLWCKISNFV